MHLASASNGSGLCYGIHFLENVKARAPLQAAACVAHGVRVVVTKIIETGRLVEVVTAWLVHHLLLLADSG
jgi:hypothetical protein